MKVEVRDLRKLNKTLTYVGDNMTPTLAVICAYAQDQDDYETWNYVEKYGKLVEIGRHTVLCGDFSAYLDQRWFDLEYGSGGRIGPYVGLPMAIETAKSLVKGIMHSDRRSWMYIYDRDTGQKVVTVDSEEVTHHGITEKERRPAE